MGMIFIRIIYFRLRPLILLDDNKVGGFSITMADKRCYLTAEAIDRDAVCLEAMIGGALP